MADVGLVLLTVAVFLLLVVIIRGLERL